MGNVVLIGKKPTLRYVLATLMLLGENEEVIIKARGKSIIKAADIIGIIHGQYLYPDLKIKDVSLDTQKGNHPYSHVSAIYITISKK